MPRLDDSRDDLLAALADHYGPQPGGGPRGVEQPLFEQLARVALGLVATPKMADAALEALRDGGMLSPALLAGANPLEIDDILKQARVAIALKSLRPLQKLARWMVDQGVDLVAADGMASLSTDFIREEWRGINGIGLASADALILLGLGRPSYPIDRATYRILVRHGWLDSDAEYDDARIIVERLARQARGDIAIEADDPQDAACTQLLVELGRWFERTGRDFCKPSQARCERCPLRPWLPANGPIEVD